MQKVRLVIIRLIVFEYVTITYRFSWLYAVDSIRYYTVPVPPTFGN